MARITWQTLIGPSVADAARPMESAARMLDNAFGGAMKVVDDQAMQLKTEKVKADEGRVQAYMDAVQGAGSVEALDALRKSGRLGELRAAILNPENAARVRGLEDRRTTELQQSWTANQAFTKAQRAAAEAPVRARVESRIAAGDFFGAEMELAANEQAGLISEAAPLYQALTSGYRSAVAFDNQQEQAGRQAAAEKRLQDAFDYEITQRPKAEAERDLRMQASRAQISAAQDARKSNEVLRAEQARDRALARVDAAQSKLLGFDAGTIGTEAGQKALTEALAKTVPKDKLPRLVGFISQILSDNPGYADLPVDVVQSAVLSHADEVATGIGGLFRALPGTGMSMDWVIRKNITDRLNAAVVADPLGSQRRNTLRTMLEDRLKDAQKAYVELGGDAPVSNNEANVALIREVLKDPDKARKELKRLDSGKN